MGKRITIKQNDFSHGMQSDTRNKNLVGQTQVFGAKKLKHFDIYQDGKLKPVQSFERFNTDDEINYGINVVGGKEGSTVYGLGQGLTNWYAPQYKKRIRLNAAFTTNDGDYVAVDLSQLSSNFWDNVNDDGSDIKITGVSDIRSVKTIVVDFDSITETGWAIARLDDIDDIYVYFDNPNAQASTGYNDLFDLTTSDFWTFDNTLNNSTGSVNFEKSSLGINVIYGTAVIGTGVTTDGSSFSELKTDVDNIGTGNSTSISFFFKANSLSDTELLDLPNQGSFINLNADGTLDIDIDLNDGGSPNSASITTTETITAGEWNYLSVSANEDEGLSVYLNGVSIASFAYVNTLESGNTDMTLTTNNEQIEYSFLSWLRQDAKSTSTQEAEGKMLTDSSFWSEQVVENFDASTVTTSGISIYQKEINGTEWEVLEYNGILIKDINSTLFPLPAFIEKDVDSNNGFFFLTSGDSDGTGIIRGGRAGFGETIIDPDDTLLNSRQAGELIGTLTLASDKEQYITSGSLLDVFAPVYKAFKYIDLNQDEQSVVYDIGWTGGVYDSFPKLSSSVKYGYGIAMVGTKAGRGSIEIWDLLNLDPETVVDLGTGLVKVIANVKGNLISVVDNYLQDEGLSRGKPTLDFRLWAGRDNVKTLQSFEFENVDTVYPNNWEYAIDNRRSDLHNASVFVAEPKTDWKGMWAIGTGEQSQQLGVSILYDTETLGRIDTHHSIGNNLVIIQNTGEIYKLSSGDVYTQTSEFESMTIDAGINHVQKEIVAIEVSLDKDLPVGQTITVSYETDGGGYDLIGTCTGKYTEFTLAEGEAFNSFHEMHLKIESTGGNAVVVDYAIKVEYEEEVV